MNGRDHGGGIDAAVARWGGARSDWIDLSTGINPVPYPVGEVSAEAWTALPDHGALERLLAAARTFWDVPEGVEIVAAAGASAPIAALPGLWPQGRVCIEGPTYNEHEAAFRTAGWDVVQAAVSETGARVIVHPNNPDGRCYGAADLTAPVMIIDESFADVMPSQSLIAQAGPGRVVLKSFGKFWGLAGVRLGFAIGGREEITRLGERLGPWAVSGPALEIGARALEDEAWAEATRERLERDAMRLDRLMEPHGKLVGGTTLFRLYDVGDAAAFQGRLARQHTWSRIFPYSERWVRLGLPGPEGWERLETAL
ncbi:threonine-phosphate decarboxylase [Alisedimentitalea sp. MJ-SS2]|uniref:threonine-phosphate decarboxylase n=1 Tax=Aliisedimentitalea sp. MJ-SS2 TaxID=3049795 RepID=UPI00290D5E94|nr:threonine-phosphate decarboxylase [Alisedimentitalea sp. MJ-SS2]MDU8929521.1 threonine-phosphate decarboxylase [Alisedimentitalea sp. MJ-SS2]